MHGKERHETSFFHETYTLTASNETDDGTAYGGYTMETEFQWLKKQPSNILKSVCKAEYQALAVFSTFSFSMSLSDLLPLGASVTFPSSYKRSELKNHMIDMYRPSTGGSGGCIAFCTPIVIDLAQDGIHLGPAGVGVSFDIDNSGEPKSYQWLRSGGDEAFLVRDLNRNGVIDHGGELFGSGTEMINDLYHSNPENNFYAPNGFVALAQFDQPVMGGNDDGVISEADEIWSQLQLWQDRNANGITELGELFGLHTTAITQLGTIPRVSQATDPAGNGLYLWSWASADSAKGLQQFKMVDVFFKAVIDH